MSADLNEERRCLRCLCAGEDQWPWFMRLFERFIYGELSKYSIRPGPERDDLAQEVALKLVNHDFAVLRRHLESDSGYSFKAVLRTVIYSVVCNEWQRRKRYELPVDLAEHPAAGEIFRREWADNPARRLYREVRLTCLLQQVVGGAGKSKAFSILVLRFVEELPVNEIAAQLEMAPNAVSQQLRYYRKKLRAVLGPEVYDEQARG